jgi:hypothetical protein
MHSGWLTTKKRGRDDDLIARDRQMALAARHLKKKPNKAAKGKPVARKVLKHPQEDGDSMDSFTVKSDEELSEVEEESDSEEDLDTFLNLTKRRVSKPPPARNPSIQSSRRPKAFPTTKKPEVVHLDDSSSDDDELEIIDAPKVSRFFTKQLSRPQANATFVSETKDVDDSDESVPATKPKNNAKKFDESDDDSFLATKPKNKKFETNVSSLSDDDSDIFAAKAPAKKITHALDHDSDEDDSQPALTGRLRKKLQDVNKKVEKLRGSKKSTTNGSKKSKKFAVQAYQDEDEDEAIALALAISRSEKENKSTIDEDDPNLVNMLLDESSEEDDDQDDYVDPAAKEATSILEQANSLSAQILETLSRWSSSSSDGTAATMGLITNGALSLSTMAQNNSKDHKWISAEVMASICPNITLAEYQLIGVNWMALLNGMKCKVNGSRGHSNVNGILADGKTPWV